VRMNRGTGARRGRSPRGRRPGKEQPFAVTLLHATDVRQVPLIAAYGLFSGMGRAPLAVGDARGKAYTRQIVTRQRRKGWEIVVLVFDIPGAWVRPAEEPAGVGFDLVEALASAAVPPTLLEALATILPQGPRIVRAFVEWQREGILVRLPPAHLDRAATLRENAALVEGRVMPPPVLADLEAMLRPEGKGPPRP
jgi:hypothetical protein